ncbi:MAG TPA: asparagine synthase-related protein [Candidatus Omnitrophota bacterium]|nr:asparagine synthase-related protein [Candidatus Omnitrophota bacterium]
MSGIAGIVIPSGGRPLAAPDLDGMARALGGEEAGPPLLLEEGRVGFVVRGASGYDSGLASRRVGNAVVGLAFFGRLTATPHAEGDREGDSGPGRGGAPLQALLSLWLDRGAACVADLRGEFVLAVYDGRDKALHLATDRIRIQPLVTANRPDQFLFGSRMAALLASPVPFAPTLDAGALLDVVASSVISAPRTIFREVDKLPAGHRLAFRNGRASAEAYWEPDFTRGDGASPESLAAATRDALAAAVRDRLARDGSGGYGAFLSGGVDSTTVTGLLTKESGGRVATFSIGFSEERFNELHYARVAASAFHTRHTEYFVTPRDTEDAVLAVAESFDEPFANASAVPTYYCAKVAREHGVTALYAGDGGDELFAGNQRYADGRVFEPYDRVPRWIRDPLLTPAIAAAGRIVPHPLFVKAGKYVRRASLPPAERIVSYDFWNVVPPAAFATSDLMAAAAGWRPAAMVIRHHDQARASTALDRHLYLDLKITISDNDVPKVARMCERAGVAVRFPFLDERVVDVATRVPARVKMRGGELRTFFKDAYKDLLPAETRAKTKHGFGLPISGWLKSDPGLQAMMRDLVLSPRSVGRGYFRREALEDVVRRHEEDATPYYGTVLWNLMVIELWHRRVLDGRSR